MSGFTRFAIALPIMVALLSGLLPASQSRTDEQAVRAVLEDYVVGWREGDVENDWQSHGCTSHARVVTTSTT
jgi:hypothetical protein